MEKSTDLSKLNTNVATFYCFKEHLMYVAEKYLHILPIFLKYVAVGEEEKSKLEQMKKGSELMLKHLSEIINCDAEIQENVDNLVKLQDSVMNEAANIYYMREDGAPCTLLESLLDNERLNVDGPIPQWHHYNHTSIESVRIDIPYNNEMLCAPVGKLYTMYKRLVQTVAPGDSESDKKTFTNITSCKSAPIDIIRSYLELVDLVMYIASTVQRRAPVNNPLHRSALIFIWKWIDGSTNALFSSNELFKQLSVKQCDIQDNHKAQLSSVMSTVLDMYKTHSRSKLIGQLKESDYDALDVQVGEIESNSTFIGCKNFVFNILDLSWPEIQRMQQNVRAMDALTYELCLRVRMGILLMRHVFPFESICMPLLSMLQVRRDAATTGQPFGVINITQQLSQLSLVCPELVTKVLSAMVPSATI